MTDLQRAASLISHAVPIGFSTPEDNERCQAIIDQLAIDILGLETDGDTVALWDLMERQQGRIEKLALDLAEVRIELKKHHNKRTFDKTKGLLERIDRKEVQEAEKRVLEAARSWDRFSHTAKLLDACRALQAADRAMRERGRREEDAG